MAVTAVETTSSSTPQSERVAASMSPALVCQGPSNPYFPNELPPCDARLRCQAHLREITMPRQQRFLLTTELCRCPGAAFSLREYI